MPVFLIRIIVLLLFINTAVAQQQQVKKRQYSKAFKFKDGIYASFDEFKGNAPSIVKREALFAWKTIFGDRIYYRDEKGEKIKIDSNKLWGYCKNGVPYIYKNHDFHRLLIVGSICYFMQINHDGEPGLLESLGSGKSSDHRIIDFETGGIMPLTLECFTRIIEKDQQLMAEFNKLSSNKERKNKMFPFLLKFNERHPVYFNP